MSARQTPVSEASKGRCGNQLPWSSSAASRGRSSKHGGGLIAPSGPSTGPAVSKMDRCYPNTERAAVPRDTNSPRGCFVERDKPCFVTGWIGDANVREQRSSQTHKPLPVQPALVSKRHVEINKESSWTEAQRSIFTESQSGEERWCL